MQSENTFALPTVLVLFGATGDLVRRKIVPALYHLYEHDRLPKLLQVIGYARRPLTDQIFRRDIAAILRHHKLGTNRAARERFLDHFFYHQGNFDRLADYRALAARLGRVDDAWQVCANKLFYLAVPPQFYKNLGTNLSRSGLTIPCGPDEGWTRVIVEKPFGQDSRTAGRLDALLGTLFREEQIYRIDHYLAKEMLQNILTFRFANNLLEETWNNRSIERIDLRLWETLGVEDRGAFYDSVGTLRDVGQNHLLQMLALITMERPTSFTADAIRPARASALEGIIPPSTSQAVHLSARGQYAGYHTIAGVRPDSSTETYFRIETELRTPRWQGVPILLEAGKRMPEVRKEIVVTFRHPRPCLCPTGEHYRNRVVFQIEPRETIELDLWAKQPGFEFAVEPQSLAFTIKNTGARRQYVEEYSKLLLDCILGDQTLFVSTDEVAAMWRAIDPYLDAWRGGDVPLVTYHPGTAQALAAADQQFRDHVRSRHHHAAVGMVGLGKMGGNLVRQLLDHEWRVVGWDPNPAQAKDLVAAGLTAASGLADLARQLPSPKVIWLMVPADSAVDDAIAALRPELKKGDVIIDGGNSRYTDTAARAKKLARRGIRLVDVGVSGGPSGARTGAVLLVGGDEATYHRLTPLFRDLGAPGGVQFFPGAGAGHFVKMIHNGIEYGMMQAIAEGFAILKKTPYKLDLTNVADVYNHGSVIESRLIGWLADAFRLHGEDLTGVSGTVGHTGEGAWTVEAAQKLGLKTKIIEGALEFRVASANHPDYAGQVLSALREQFGGHSVK